MTDRPIRLYGLLGKLEAAYGVAETAFDQFDGMLCVAPPQITFEYANVDRNLALPWMGASEQVTGTRHARIKFKTEMVGAGVAGDAPEWGKWLRACGMVETIVAGSHVKYQFANDNFEGMTCRFNRAGVRYQTRGMRGSAKINMDAYTIPTIDFDMLGFDVTPVADAVPAIDLSKFVSPQSINTENSGSLLMDPTVGIGGTATGGTVLPSKGISWDFGTMAKARKLIDGERIAISDRKVTGKTTVDLSVADEVAWWTAMRQITTNGLHFQHGVGAGRQIAIYAPRAQRFNPQGVDDDGFLLTSVDLVAMPGLSGASELKIYAR